MKIEFITELTHYNDEREFKKEKISHVIKDDYFNNLSDNEIEDLYFDNYQANLFDDFFIGFVFDNDVSFEKSDKKEGCKLISSELLSLSKSLVKDNESLKKELRKIKKINSKLTNNNKLIDENNLLKKELKSKNKELENEASSASFFKTLYKRNRKEKDKFKKIYQSDMKLRYQIYNYIEEIIDLKSRELTSEEEEFYENSHEDVKSYKYFNKRRNNEYLIDLNGTIQKLEDMDIVDNDREYHSISNPISIHTSIARKFFPNAAYAHSYAVSIGWITIGSHVGRKVEVMPNSRQIETLKKLGHMGFYFEGKWINI